MMQSVGILGLLKQFVLTKFNFLVLFLLLELENNKIVCCVFVFNYFITLLCVFPVQVLRKAFINMLVTLTTPFLKDPHLGPIMPSPVGAWCHCCYPG